MLWIASGTHVYVIDLNTNLVIARSDLYTIVSIKVNTKTGDVYVLIRVSTSSNQVEIFSLKGAPVPPSVVFEGEINFSSKYDPLKPNLIQITAEIKNVSNSDSIPELNIAFFDGHPQSGGKVIGSEMLSDFAAQTSRQVSAVWELDGNVENKRIFVRAAVGDAFIMKDEEVTIYYIQFLHREDAYSFRNSELDPFSTGDDLGEFFADIDFPLPVIKSLYGFINVLTEVNGWCYGMSNSSLVYKANPLLKPIPEKTTFEHDKFEARAKIRTYQSSALWPGLLALANLLPNTPSEQYALTRENIKGNSPVIHIWMKRNGSQILPGPGAHAVVPYKIIEIGENKRVYYYDNNKPDKDFQQNQEEAYSVFRDDTFKVESSAYSVYEYNKAYVVKPRLSSQDDIRSLGMIIQRLFEGIYHENMIFVGLSGPGELLAVDSQGRRAGIFNGQRLGEIPGAFIATSNGEQSLWLPWNSKYELRVKNSITASATIVQQNGEGIQLSILDLTSTSSGRFIEFRNISVIPDEFAIVRFGHGDATTQLELPGVSAKQPELNETFSLPVVSFDLHLPLLRK